MYRQLACNEGRLGFAEDRPFASRSAVVACADFDPKQRRILQRAAQAFVIQGYAEARLEDIAIDAGVGKPTLYRYFGNKEDLLRSVMLASLAEFIASSAVDFDAERSVEEVLVEYATRMISAMFTELSSGVSFHRISRLLYAINLSQPHLVEEICAIFRREMSDSLIRYFTDIMRQETVWGNGAGLELPTLATHFFQCVFFTCLAQPVGWRPGPSDIAELARKRVRLFLYGAAGLAPCGTA